MPGPDVSPITSLFRVLSTLLSSWDVAGNLLTAAAGTLKHSLGDSSRAVGVLVVPEPFRAEGPELGEVCLGNGCKVSCV